eukprot:5778781-Prymnesium_polylepis.1
MAALGEDEPDSDFRRPKLSFCARSEAAELGRASVDLADSAAKSEELLEPSKELALADEGTGSTWADPGLERCGMAARTGGHGSARAPCCCRAWSADAQRKVKTDSDRGAVWCRRGAGQVSRGRGTRPKKKVRARGAA